MFWILVAVVVIALLAVAWWSSGRSRRRLGRPDAKAESMRAQGQLDAYNRHTRNETGGGMYGP